MQDIPPPMIFKTDTQAPILGGGIGPYSYQLVSDPGKRTQFDAFIEELAPGSTCGCRHWHEDKDEMTVSHSGSVILVEDHDTSPHAGDSAVWPAGHSIGYRLYTRGREPGCHLVIGRRSPRDVVQSTDHDLITHKGGPTRRHLHRDGTLWPVGDLK